MVLPEEDEQEVRRDIAITAAVSGYDLQAVLDNYRIIPLRGTEFTLESEADRQWLEEQVAEMRPVIMDLDSMASLSGRDIKDDQAVLPLLRWGARIATTNPALSINTTRHPMTETPRRCGYEKADGRPCATPMGLCDDCGLCFAHCPCRAEEARTARSAGARAKNAKHPRRKGKGRGKGRGKDVRTVDPAELPFDGPPSTVDEVYAWLAWIAWAGTLGVMDRDTVGKISYALDKCRIAMERGERYEERLKEVERRLKDRDRR